MRRTEVDTFLRASEQRLTSSQVLFDNQMYLDAMYLSGYAAECAIKALILNNLPVRKRGEFMREHFRGELAHNFEHLKWLLRGRKVNIPLEIKLAFRPIATWSTSLRYQVGRGSAIDAANYLKSAATILAWAKRSI